jgi:hypothetical protein
MKRTRCGKVGASKPRGRLPASGWRRYSLCGALASVPFFKVEGLGVGGVRRGKATPGYEESRG